MKIKMWCLINKKKDRIIKISDSDNCFAIGYNTKKDLLTALEYIVEAGKTIRKIEFEI